MYETFIKEHDRLERLEIHAHKTPSKMLTLQKS